MNAKLAILSVVLCIASAAQSIHLHPSGRQLVFSHGTNTLSIDRRYCWNRIHKFESELNGLRSQLEMAQKWCREHPPRITMLEQEIETQRLHLKLMDLLGVTNAPSSPVEMPPMPPALPVNASVRSGLPANHQPEFIPRRDVMTAKE